jgi:hypothetical protein
MENAGLLNTIDLDKTGKNSIVTEDGFLVAKGKKNIFWYRGITSGIYVKGATMLGFPFENERVSGGALMREAARYFGWDIRLNRPIIPLRAPTMSVSRHNNGFWFSTCFPNTTIGISLRTPYGAPLMIGYETVYKDGRTNYHFPRAEHRECRIFVEECENSVISCKEMFPGELDVKIRGRRRISIEGLKNATLRFFPETYAIGKSWAVMSELHDRYTADFEQRLTFEQDGESYIAKNITGTIVVYMPDYEDCKTRYVEEASRFE